MNNYNNKQLAPVVVRVSVDPENEQPTPRPRTKKKKQPQATMSKVVQDQTKAMAVAYYGKRTGVPARMKALKNGATSITHKALIGPVSSTSLYAATLYPVNPGMSQTFPWLSKLARRYDEYRITQLKYHYRSVSATSTPGVVMLSFDYDAADLVPTTKSIQAQSIPNEESNSWNNISLVVPTDSLWRFIRPGALAANLDVKTYDLGNLVVGTSYGSGAISGELYVEYTVELRKPSAGTVDAGRLGYTPTAFNAPFITPIINGFPPCVTTSANVLTCVTSGEWMVSALTTGTVMTSSTPLPVINTSGGGAALTLATFVAATTTETLFKLRLEAGDTMTFANIGAGATITGVFLRFAPIDYDIMV